MGVTQHQIVGGHQDDEHTDHPHHGKRPNTRKQERPERQNAHNNGQYCHQCAAPGVILRHRFDNMSNSYTRITGISPWGRHISTATISPTVATAARRGSRKPTYRLMRPTRIAPKKQPFTEPRPPRMMTTTTEIISSSPICAVISSSYMAHMAPPRPANAEPAMKTPKNSRCTW